LLALRGSGVHRFGCVTGERRQAGGFITGIARPPLQAQRRGDILDIALLLRGRDDFDRFGRDLPAGRVGSLLAPAADPTAATAPPRFLRPPALPSRLPRRLRSRGPGSSAAAAAPRPRRRRATARGGTPAGSGYRRAPP